MQKQYAEGLVDEIDVNKAADRMMALVEKYNPKGRLKKSHKYHETAVSVAKKCAVLLKNDGALPLENPAEVIVVGELARTMRFQGGGSSHINVPEYINAIEAFEKKGIKVKFAPGYRVDSNERDIQLEMEASELVKNTDCPVIFFGGLTDLAEGEGYDRTTLSMQDNQLRVFDRIYEENQNIIFISFSGAPYDIPFRDKVKAILHMYLCGEATGEAAVSILTGETNPSGKLAETFPVKIEDTPAFGSFGSREKNVDYNEGVLIGYRYYDTKKVDPAYPFGYGLSYTSFEYSDLKVERGEKPLECKVTLTVKNTGDRDGYEAVQIYVQNPQNQIARGDFNGRPVKELKGFAKPFIKAGECAEVTVVLDARSFAIYDVNNRAYVVPEGEYAILAAASSADIRLSENVDIKRSASGYEKAELEVISEAAAIESMNVRKYYLADGDEGDPHIDFNAAGSNPYTLSSSLLELSKDSKLAEKMLKFGEESIYKRFQGKPHDDPEVLMYLGGLREGTIDCAVINSNGAVSYKVAEKIVKQANRHAGK